MQFYQNHVVFQSFSDMYYLEQHAKKRQQQRMEALHAIQSINRDGAKVQKQSPSSSRAPSLDVHDLSRTSSRDSHETSITSVYDEEDQYYPNALYSSQVQKRLNDKEADIVTLDDQPGVAGRVPLQDLTLQRY